MTAATRFKPRTSRSAGRRRRARHAARQTAPELNSADHARLAMLTGLCHRRWSLPILAELQRNVAGQGAGAKFITLANRLRLSRETLRDTLDDLIARDYLMRNPGIGHPMRPEYLLTEDGHDAAPAAAALVAALRRNDLEDVALRKWSLPALYAIARGQARFSEIKSALRGVTSRALTLTLKDLQSARLIRRSVTRAYPPGVWYAATRAGRTLARLLARLD